MVYTQHRKEENESKSHVMKEKQDKCKPCTSHKYTCIYVKELRKEERE